MLLKLLSEAKSDHVVVIFDAGRETFRKDLYPEYKANREACPEDLLKQMPYFREIAQTLGMLILEEPGYEADDLIGTLVKRFESEDFETVIVTGDKDLMQLVNKRVTIWDTMRDRHFGPKEVKEKMGVGPAQIVELLGLMGDSSDNIPGLMGVGPKTAVQLIEKYGDVESVIQQAGAIKTDKGIRNRAKIAEQIELNPEILRLSRKLVEINTQAPLRFSLAGKEMSFDNVGAGEIAKYLQRSEIDPSKLEGLFARLEFHSLLKEFKLSSPAKKSENVNSYRAVFQSDFPGFVSELKKQKSFAFDLETTSLDVLVAKIVGVSFSWDKDGAFYVPLGHANIPQGSAQVSHEEFFKALGPIFEDPEILKCGQNLKYDVGVLCQYGFNYGFNYGLNCGFTVQGIAFDSMIASYLLNPDKGAHDLGVLARDFLQRHMQDYEEVAEGLADFSQVPVDAATRYSGDDANVAWNLKCVMEPLLKESQLERVFNELEMPLVALLSKMERTGIKLDVPFLAKYSGEIEGKLSKVKEQIFAAAGTEFNLNSPKQLSEILFVKLNLPTKGLKKTKTGVSTDQGVLEKLSGLHPLPALLLEHRLLYKLKSTYVDALPAQVSSATGRLHTRFNQTVTGTGRLSSSDPNLQNIPIQTPEGRKVREAFIAEEGKVLIAADYSQIELRILAHLSADPNLCRAFKEGEDIHTITAREILGLGSLLDITPEQRRVGKTINFGVIYGMGPYRLARDLQIPFNVANKYIEEYFERYSGVKRYFAEIEKRALEDGFVSTLFGRRRLVGSIDDSERDQGFVLRAALNAPIQGSAADIVKLAMIKVDRALVESGLKVRMLLQIHDELVFECARADLDAGMEIIVNQMENVVQLDVPLKVDAGSGSNWQEAQS